jgi:hypothetical protein
MDRLEKEAKMKRQFKIVLMVLLGGVVVLGMIFAQRIQQRPPANVPVAVTFYDTYTDNTGSEVPCMWRSDTGGEYINGVDAVSAVINGEYGEFNFEIAKNSPRRVIMEFNETSKIPCEGCTDRQGRPISAPAPGTVNYIFFSTFNRSAWACESRWAFDCTQDYLHMAPGFVGYTNSRIGFATPKFEMFFFGFIRACTDPPQIGYVFVHAGQDRNNDGYADEWDLYPIPPGFVPPAFGFNGEQSVLTLIQGGGKICNFGIYEIPFKIHIRKI